MVDVEAVWLMKADSDVTSSMRSSRSSRVTGTQTGEQTGRQAGRLSDSGIRRKSVTVSEQTECERHLCCMTTDKLSQLCVDARQLRQTEVRHQRLTTALSDFV